ncbi:right-handed parallel beta-helix repeat-containing protein [uncultured Hymenobacter sp.]|uniref:right-handed parallel beta-helix repeat-containing protein n=1 Tax=uncultured Hymenobacter sp. TaxID=170016 RepID=UPI0035C99453
MIFSLSLKHLTRILALLLVGLALPVRATDYYVSSTGNNDNAGTTAGSAWRSINKANESTFLSGDRLLFEGGQRFAGTIWLTAADGGVASAPLVISSYGTGRATIDGGAGKGLLLTGATGVQISALNFVGLGRKTGNQGGQGILITDATSITIDQVEASGFQRAGVEFHNCTNVRLTNVYAHDNGFAGIAGLASTNVYIGYCRAINNPGDPTVTTNHSGNGILFSGREATIEYCEAAYNGYDMQQVNDNGPVGIWCYEADQVIIQHCISHNNQSPKYDGGGFDFDSGVTNSVMQYNYAYENKCYGFVTWQHDAATSWSNNVIRYNISINNAGPGLIVGAVGGGATNNCEVYNNIFYSDAHPAVAQYSRDGVNNFNFRNNVFIGISSHSLVATTSGLTYQANNYWFIDGGFNIGGYESLAAWAAATDQEKRNGSLVGLNADPQLRDPTNYEKLTDPTRLTTLTAFLVSANSAIVDKGLDLRTLFGFDPGRRDFYGNAIAAGQGFDIGVQEVVDLGPLPTPSTCTGTGGLLREQWNNISGSSVSSLPLTLAPSSSGPLPQFEAVTSTDFNYGARLRGYVCPPQSGAYIFSIAGDDEAELWLSTDELPTNKVRLASSTGWTSGPHDYTRYASQQSAAVNLVAGKRYYIEALHKQSWGPGYVSVTWRLPDGRREEPIAGTHLSPLIEPTRPAVITATTPQADAATSLSAYPNPFSRQASVQFHLGATGPATLSLYDVRGQLVRQLFSGHSAAGTVQRLTLQGQGLRQGLYVLRLVTDQQVLIQRVAVGQP